MALPAVLAAISLGGSLVSTGAAFFDAKAKKRAARRNFDRQLANIQQQYTAGLESIQSMVRQGEGYIGSQRVAAASTGVSGSVDAAVSASQGFLLRDQARARAQLDMNMQAAREQALINLQAANTAATNQQLAAGGSLLTSVAQFGISGYNAGLFGGGVSPGTRGTSRPNRPVRKVRRQGGGYNLGP